MTVYLVQVSLMKQIKTLYTQRKYKINHRKIIVSNTEKMKKVCFCLFDVYIKAELSYFLQKTWALTFTIPPAILIFVIYSLHLHTSYESCIQLYEEGSKYFT